MLLCGYMELSYPQMIWQLLEYPQAYPHLCSETLENKAYKSLVSGIRRGY